MGGECRRLGEIRPALELARFQNKVEKERPETSQPKATPWVFVYTSVSPRRGKRMKSSFPFPQPFVWVLILLPFQGVIPAASSPPGRCPGLAYQCPLRGVGSLTFRRICYPPESNIRIFNPQYPAEQPPRKRGVCVRLPPFGRAGVGFPFVQADMLSA